jgi:hypothetical protein
MAKSNQNTEGLRLDISDAQTPAPAQSRKWQLKNNAKGLQVGMHYINFEYLSDEHIDQLIEQFPQIKNHLEQK